MHDNWLVAIALCVSALGITGLLFALLLLEVPLTPISEAAMQEDGRPVRVTGTVQAVRSAGGMTIITISQPSTLDLVLDGNLTINATCLTAWGKKGTYQGKVQVNTVRLAQCG